MPTKLKDMQINRVSLVKKPATRRYFLLRKEADIDELEPVELVKAMNHHFEAIMDLIGADDEMKSKVGRIADLMDEGGVNAASRLNSFLWQLRDMKSMLESVLSKEGEEEDQEDSEEETEWNEKDFALAKKKLTAAERNRLPRSAFAWVDDDGKGHLPIHDETHVRNAMARFNQTHFPDEVTKKRALRRILAAARRMGIEVDEEKWRDQLSKEGRLMTEDKDTKVQDKSPVSKDEEVVTKADYDAVLELLKVEKQEREKVEKRLADLEESNKASDYLRKAEGYKHLNIPPADLAKMIRVMDEQKLDWKTHFDRLEKEASESALLKEHGTGGEGRIVREGVTPFETEVNRRVAERIAKGDTRKEEKIRGEVIIDLQREQADLYREHVILMRERR